MNYQFLTPAKLRLHGTEAEIRALRTELTYEDQKVVEELRRLKKNPWFANKYGDEAYKEKLDELEAAKQVCLVEEDANGDPTTLGGFYARFAAKGWGNNSRIVCPEPQAWPYKRKPHEARYFQRAAVDALIAARHGAISLPTGAGKSLIIMMLIREVGQRALIMAPGESIARQLYEDLKHHLGDGKVGLYGDGRHDMKQDVIVGIAASLQRVEPGTPQWAALGGRPIFITDESHLVAAATFKKVALGVAARSIYRWFLSATQFRNDGTDILLEGVTGPVVYEKDLYELVAEGFLAKPVHVCIGLQAESQYVGPYPQMVQHHFYENKKLHRIAAQLANRFYKMTGFPSLILIDHVEQFANLYPHLAYDVGFAHGTLTKENRDCVPADFQKANDGSLKNAFNEMSLPILVGTSCISVGTDLRPTGAVIYLRAGESEIMVRQAMGRGTRLVTGKTKFYFVDFGISIQDLKPFKNPLWRHYNTRCSYYRDPQFIKPAQLGIVE